MIKRKKYKPPINLIVLDFFGAILVGLGIYEWMSDSSLISDHYKFENYPVAMMVVGGLMMLPVPIHLINFARGGKSSGPREI